MLKPIGIAFLIFGLMATMAQETSSGLILKLSSKDGKTDYRTSRLAALFVPEGGTASPFISKGAFTAEYNGLITLQARRRIFFSAKGNGKLSVSIKVADDNVVSFTREGDFFKTGETERHRINPGTYPISIKYESPKSGESYFRLYWREDRFEWPLEPIPPNYFTHKSNAELASSLEKRHGRQLIADLKCTKCHSTGDLPKDAMPELNADAPDFKNIGGRLKGAWLAKWLKDPKAVRPQATMPNLHLKDNDVADVLAYLNSLKMKQDAPRPKHDIKAGGGLFHDLGCVACHMMPDTKELKDNFNRIPLSNVKSKYNFAALKEFIKEPNKHYKWVRMPDFGLNDKQAGDIAEYLYSTAASEKDSKLVLGDAKKGQQLAIERGCMNCHEPTQAKDVAPALSKLKWSGGCLEGKHADYQLTDKEKKAIVNFAKSDLSSLKKQSLVEFSHRQIKGLNCIACHERDSMQDILSRVHDESAKVKVEHKNHGHLDQSRPLLTWIGEKLNTKWTEDLLAGKLDYKPRPWLLAKMPEFKSRASMLASGMSHDHGFDGKKEEAPVVDTKAAGKELLGAKGFSCIICHDTGKGKAIAAFEVKGLNLGVTNERLTYEYYMRWMKNPQRIVSHTKMPRYSTDGTSSFQQLEGDANKQFDAIWQYLKDGMAIEKPEGAK